MTILDVLFILSLHALALAHLHFRRSGPALFFSAAALLVAFQILSFSAFQLLQK